MDADRFDALARILSTGYTRRGVARLLGSVSLAGALSVRAVGEVVAALRNGGTDCTGNAQCKTGRCVGPVSHKVCGCSRKFPTCKQPANPCKKAKCDFATNRCVTVNKSTGTICAGGTCQGGACQPDPCPGQKLCEGTCIATTECCTREDCSANAGFKCCNGLCTNAKNDPGLFCLDDNVCCSDYCRSFTASAKTCAATCRGKSCTPAEGGCCPGFPCLELDSGVGRCGGCGESGDFCASAAECCFSACTAQPSAPLIKGCLSYAGGPCATSYDCWSCYFHGECGVMINGFTQAICTDGICGCPDECCANSDCPFGQSCDRDRNGLNGVCKPPVIG